MRAAATDRRDADCLGVAAHMRAYTHVPHASAYTLPATAVTAPSSVMPNKPRAPWELHAPTVVATLIVSGLVAFVALGFGIAALAVSASDHRSESPACDTLPGTYYYHIYDSKSALLNDAGSVQTPLVGAQRVNRIEAFHGYFPLRRSSSVDAPSIAGAYLSWQGTVLHSYIGRTYDETCTIHIGKDYARFHSMYTEPNALPDSQPYSFGSSTVVTYAKLNGTDAFRCAGALTIDFTKSLGHMPREIVFLS